jgi:YHS domain-containing protein
MCAVLNKLTLFAAIAMNVLLLSQAFADPATQPAKVLVNVDKSGLAIKGNDPVAYFTDGKAVQGDPQITSTYNGATYRLVSSDHKAMFDADPMKYAPQFGGYCAYGASKNTLAPITPEAFSIVDGRLLLQYDLGVRDKFNKDVAGNLKKADANWPALVKKNGKAAN